MAKKSPRPKPVRQEKTTTPRQTRAKNTQPAPEPNAIPFSTLENPRQRAFLAAYCETYQLIQAARDSGVSIWTHYGWRSRDSDYRDAYRQCRKVAGDKAEDEAYRRAVLGLRRYKFGKGGKPLINPETGEPYYEHEYSDTLILALLRATKPEKYRERSERRHTFETAAQGDGLTEFFREKLTESNGHSRT